MTSAPLPIGLVGDGPRAHEYSEAVRRTTGLAPTVAPVDLLLSDDAITAVIVAAGDADAVTAALTIGRLVLVDPAVLPSLDRPEQLRELTRAGDGALLVARPWRFHDVCGSLRATVDAGDLGPPAFFQWVSEGATTRLADDGADTSATVQTIIGLDLALWLLGGQPERVFARPAGSDGTVISLRFANGANALLELRPRLTASGASYGFAWLLGPRGEARWEQRADNLAIDQRGVHFAPLDLRSCLAATVAHAIACWRGDADRAGEAESARALLAAIGAVNDSLRLAQPVEIPAHDKEVRR